MNSIILLFVLSVIATIEAEVTPYRSCSDDTSHCSIKELRVNPCPEAENNKPCLIKKGNTAEIEFDYVGIANVTDLTTKAYWSTAAADLPLVGMDTTGCKFTKCPTTSDEQKFTYNLEMSKKFPARSYDVKWRLFKEGQMDCCLIFKIKLVK